MPIAPSNHCVSSVDLVPHVTVNINITIVYLFMFPASAILEKIIGTLVDKQLVNIERLEMLTTSKLRTFCFSWLDKEHLSAKGKDEMDVTIITDILYTTSVSCPVTIF